MALKLQAKYTITIVTLIVVIAALLSMVLLFQFQSTIHYITREGVKSTTNDLIKEVKKRAIVMATQLGENLANPLYELNMEQIGRLVQVTKRENEVMYIHVYDTEGRIVHDGTKTIKTYGKPIAHLDLTQAAARGIDAVTHVQGQELSVVYPIRLGDEHVGGVLIALSLDHMSHDVEMMNVRLTETGESSLNRNFYIVLLLTTILVIVGVAIAYVIASRLIRPIKQLSINAKQIGHGNYDVAIDVSRGDELGDLSRVLDEMRDNLKHNSDKIHYLAHHDSLTGLPNRIMFKNRLDHMIEYVRQHKQGLALLFIDVDDFKRINDNFGHHAGDIVLQTLAERIGGCIRAEDLLIATREEDRDKFVARLGGDEFIALLPISDNPMDAGIAARRVLESVTEPVTVEGHRVSVSASIGIAVFPLDGETATDLLTNADIAMYHAKSEGKNNYQYFTSAMNQKARYHMEVEIELRKALDNRELEIYFQPFIDLRDDHVIGAEALVRWNHPTRGLVLPDDFIPVAEESGLILEICEYVIRTSTKQIQSWRTAGYSALYVAVNISSVQLRRQNLADLVEKILRETGLPPQALHLEITESSLIKTEDIAKKTLDRLRALGVRIWLDDFGTGYSSLSYLRRFSVDGVKIDKSFVHDMCNDEDDRALTHAIISMAHSLKLRVVAEGVETQDQQELLKKADCDLAQGYYYDNPVPALKFEKLLMQDFAKTSKNRNYAG